MKMLIGVIVVVVVIGAGAYYFMSSRGEGGAAGTMQTLDEAGGGGEGGAFSGSLAQLGARGGNWKCTFEASAGEAVSSGAIYVSGSRMRGEFGTTAVGSGEMKSYMINDGEFTYTWSSAASQGIKMKTPVGGDAAATPETGGQGADLNQAYSYNCAPWSADASVFTPPANISFMEFALPQ